MSKVNGVISLDYKRHAGGHGKQRRTTVQRRIQAHRKWWRDEGRPLFRGMFLAGGGGGIFGVSLDTSPPEAP